MREFAGEERMNRTQKRIIGWALIAFGVLMVIGAAMSSFEIYRYTTFRTREFSVAAFLKNPMPYIALVLGVVGLVVLAGLKREGEMKD